MNYLEVESWGIFTVGCTKSRTLSDNARNPAFPSRLIILARDIETNTEPETQYGTGLLSMDRSNIFLYDKIDPRHKSMN